MYGWWGFEHCPQVWRWRALLRAVDMLLVMKGEEQWRHCQERRRKNERQNGSTFCVGSQQDHMTSEFERT